MDKLVNTRFVIHNCLIRDKVSRFYLKISNMYKKNERKVENFRSFL